MIPNTRVAAVTSEFNDFLYAPIVEECNGMPLSMLSALARLNVDPWEEAARLAKMPREVAIKTLATLLAALPHGLAERPDSGTLADRLVALLPRQVESRMPSTITSSVAELRANFHVLTLSIVGYVIFSIIFMVAQWMMGTDKMTPSSIAPATTPAAVSLNNPAPLSASPTDPPH